MPSSPAKHPHVYLLVLVANMVAVCVPLFAWVCVPFPSFSPFLFFLGFGLCLYLFTPASCRAGQHPHLKHIEFGWLTLFCRTRQHVNASWNWWKHPAHAMANMRSSGLCIQISSCFFGFGIFCCHSFRFMLGRHPANAFKTQALNKSTTPHLDFSDGAK